MNEGFFGGSMKKRIAFFVTLIMALTALVEKAEAFDFSFHGYYRTRGVFTYDLDLQKKNSNLIVQGQDDDRFGLLSYNQQRLRLQPELKLNDYLSIQAEFDILDNLLYGTGDTTELQIQSPIIGTISLPAGAGSIGMVGGAAGENGSINVRRVWGDIMTPVGKLRVGRQPSHWGLGIFQNDGNELQGDFGDSVDRIMFVTQKPFDNGGALNLGLIWDIPFQAQPDPRTQGLAGQIRDNGQSTHQYAAVILYEQPEFTIGTFGGVRRRSAGYGNPTTVAKDLAGNYVPAGLDGNTFMWFADAYGRYSWREYNFKFEYVHLGGKISTGVAMDAIPFSGLASPGIIEMLPDSDISVNMAAFEADAKYSWGGEWSLKSGFAQGDAAPLSTRITQYGFRPDYQIALMMFNMPMGTSPVLRDGTTNTYLTGGVPVTGNNVNNAIYVAATYKHHFKPEIKNINDLSVGGRFVTAWAHKPPVSLDFQSILGDPNLPILQSKKKWYGWEFDLLLEGEFYDHLYAALESGLLMPGGAYDIDVNMIQPGNVIAPVLPNKSNWGFMTRLTLMMQF